MSGEEQGRESAMLLTEQGAALRLGLKPRMMRDLRRRREIGYVKVGRHVRYRPADLERFVKSHVVEAGH